MASVPTTPSVDLNPHHLHDFTAKSFREMGARHGLREKASLPQVQRVNPLDVASRRRFKRSNLRPNLPAWYAGHPGALVRRIGSTLRFGFANHYLTVTWQRGFCREDKVATHLAPGEMELVLVEPHISARARECVNLALAVVLGAARRPDRSDIAVELEFAKIRHICPHVILRQQASCEQKKGAAG